MSKLFGVARCIICHKKVTFNRSIHYLKVRHLTDKRIGNSLKYEYSRLALGRNLHFIAICKKLVFLCSVTWEGLCNLIKHSPYAPKLCCSSAEYGNYLTVNNTLVNRIDNLHIGYLLAAKVFLHKVLIGACNSLHKHITELLNRLHRLIGNKLYTMTTVIIKHVRYLLNKVDTSLNLSILYHRNCERTNMLSKGGVKRIKNTCKSCIIIIKFINKECLGKSCLVSIIPRKLCSNLNTCLTVYNDNCAIGNTYRLVYLANKIKITRSIKNVYLAILPYHIKHRG